MNSTLASIGKNLILIGIVFLSAFNFFYNSLNWQELLAIQTIASVFYVFLSCYEFLNASFKASLPVQRFPYFTNRFMMARFFKTTLFLALSVLLYASGSSVKYLFPICLMISLTEGLITFLKYKKSLCFVNIYANYLLIAQTKLVKVFASEILIIEFRHDIFYFVKKDKKSVQIKLEHIHNRITFIKSISDWITRNNILVSDESKKKIKELSYL